MAKNNLGIIGVGAFGRFITRYLAPHFNLILHDQHHNLSALKKKYQVKIGDLSTMADCNIIVLAVPVQKMETVLAQLAPLLKPGTLVIDVASVKLKPTKMMKKILPKYVDIVGTHPLFGPQSGKHGITGLNIVVCNVRGKRAACIRHFCRMKLGLRVFEATARQHDQQLAYVQGLTHLLAKIVVGLDLPPLLYTTKTFDHMIQMVEMVRYDSDELFKAIEKENPFSAKAKKSFFAVARRLEKRLKHT